MSKYVPNKKTGKKKQTPGNKKTNNNFKKKAPVKKVTPKVTEVTYKNGMTVAELAEAMQRPASDLIKKLMFMRVMASQNQEIDKDNAELLAMEFGLEFKEEVITDLSRFEEMEDVDDEADLVERPAVVTIMGHVDHGKTTLLDNMRNSRVVASEAGGITQHIGAYQIKRNGKAITFIDTPGHAAFTEMRARGARITDIVVLVVAADDGVMPQTREAIDHAKASECSIIVAVNKMDKAGANPDRVKQELADLGLLPDDWGGETPFCNISALKGDGIDNLLDTIQLVAEMAEFKANPNKLASGTVIEAKLDKGRGPVATILINNGTLKNSDVFVAGTVYGKVRRMNDDLGKTIKEAIPGSAVEIIGLQSIPQAGDPFKVFKEERIAKQVAEDRANRAFDEQHTSKAPLTLDEFFKAQADDSKQLELIIKADVQGSIEAFRGSINKINVEGAKISIVRTGVGAVTDTDVLLAEASHAIIIGFGVGVPGSVRALANEKGIEIRGYRVIYEALDDIEAAMKGMLDPVFEQSVIGELEVRETYAVSRVGTIAGCKVINGVVQKGSLVKLVRNGIIIFEGNLGSLKRFKDDVKEVKSGYECGVTIENFNDIKEGDIIEVSKMKEV